eukprot:1180075-Prorocentrum_minimum.AAC.2
MGFAGIEEENRPRPILRPSSSHIDMGGFAGHEPPSHTTNFPRTPTKLSAHDRSSPPCIAQQQGNQQVPYQPSNQTASTEVRSQSNQQPIRLCHAVNVGALSKRTPCLRSPATPSTPHIESVRGTAGAGRSGFCKSHETSYRRREGNDAVRKSAALSVGVFSLSAPTSKQGHVKRV